MEALTEKIAERNYSTEFEQWWHSTGTWVEPANQRRGGESGVRLLHSPNTGYPLLYCKLQSNHIYRSLLHPLGRPTILRELEAYRAFARLGIGTARIVYCMVRRHEGQKQALLVTEALQGFISLEQWYASKHDTTLTKAMLRQLATTLKRLYLAGWQHGCCYPKHIFVKVQGRDGNEPSVEIVLLDLEKSRRRWWISRTSRCDLDQLGRHRGAMPDADMTYLRQAYQQALNDPWGMLRQRTILPIWIRFLSKDTVA